MHVEVTFTPAEFENLRHRDLGTSACAVFDILRATSTIVTALARGAESVLPVATVAEAIACRAGDASVLLAGERNGLRITSDLSGGVEFHLGNSPREYTAEMIRGRRIITTTTNGTRAFAACRHSRHLLAASFLNLKRTAGQLIRSNCHEVLLVCSGTGEGTAFEDCLAAGAMCSELLELDPGIRLTDSACVAADLFAGHKEDLEASLKNSSNAQRLLSIVDLAGDVSFCLNANLYPIIVVSDPHGRLHRPDL